ncbi:DinB family protein [Paenibacillus physcomitrellae]|uniref:Formate dehydrogenase n=1 Tax=Paenibacillus physcomitrellae TaxID=1619311 RepID=A0ABQ1GJV3_9BACL|nr:DinB family protein [Paenibacillus physcomitrellae]GGA45224.1 formate dehydrogenase [Paenibacillus physcomitrellae]
MSDPFIFNLIGTARQNIVKLLDNVAVEQRTVIPEGFNNNLHWQIGHIVTVAERLAYSLRGEPSELPGEYMQFFNTGTRPADWNGEPPAWEDILAVMESQLARIREVFEDRLDEALAHQNNFANARTFRNLLELNVAHENSHVGMINAMIRVLKRP